MNEIKVNQWFLRWQNLSRITIDSTIVQRYVWHPSTDSRTASYTCTCMHSHLMIPEEAVRKWEGEKPNGNERRRKTIANQWRNKEINLCINFHAEINQLRSFACSQHLHYSIFRWAKSNKCQSDRRIHRNSKRLYL